MADRKVQLPSLQLRADLSTIDAEARTVEAIFTTGADVQRSEFWTGESYIERLGHGREGDPHGPPRKRHRSRSSTPTESV